VADQAHGVAGLENVQLLAADGLLNSDYLALSQSEGMYFSGPDVRFGQNVNQSTGKTAAEVLSDYEANHGEAPSAPFWGHSYDATAMLLDAIKNSSSVNDAGQLVIDKAAVRTYLTAIRGYSGVIGTINCDDFGDCGSQKITVVHHTDSGDVDGGMSNVVFEYAP
jgi:branched-chain amino acid transport system substrate-binding protein